MDILIKKLSASARLPSYAHAGDAGMDVYANATLTLPPNGRGLVPTGLVLEIPEGFEAQVRPKSGLALNHGLVLPNSPGTIDAGYRGELKIIVANLGEKPFRVEKGKKIAQLVFARVERAVIKEGEPSKSARGSRGFGSTGLE